MSGRHQLGRARARWRNRSDLAAQRRRERVCDACWAGLHTKCNDKLAWVFGDDPDQPAPCPCGCWNPDTLRTSREAILDMSRRQPDYTAQHLWIQEGLADYLHACKERGTPL